MLGQERHAARAEAKTADVIKEEVLQLVGADDVLGGLRRPGAALVAWNQLGGDLRLDDRLQYSTRVLVELAMSVFGTEAFTL
jgi:hypothetical protein